MGIVWLDTRGITWLRFSSSEGVSGDRFRELREEIGKFSFVSHVLKFIQSSVNEIFTCCCIRKFSCKRSDATCGSDILALDVLLGFQRNSMEICK